MNLVKLSLILLVFFSVSCFPNDNIRLSVFGGLNNAGNISTQYENENGGIYDVEFEPDKDGIPSFYGVEAFVPIFKKAGIAAGYKQFSDIITSEITVDASQEANTIYKLAYETFTTKINTFYINLECQLNPMVYVFGGLNFPSIEFIYNRDETPDFTEATIKSDLKSAIGLQVGAGYQLSEFLAVFAQVDFYSMYPKSDADDVWLQVWQKEGATGDSNFYISNILIGARLDFNI